MRNGIASLIALLAFAPQQPATFTTHSDLVVLRVSVTDRKGVPVSDLTQNDFAVYEDDRRQTVSFFSAEDMPVTVGLVIDNSSSMALKFEHVVTAGLAFAQLSRTDDEFFVVGFNEHVRDGLPQASPFTHDGQVLRSALTRTRPDGQTAMYDAIAHALEYLDRGQHSQKALVVVSDGRDTASATTLTQLTRKAAQSRAVIYTVGLYAKDDLDANPGVLAGLASMTGGEAFFPTDNFNVVLTLERIAHDIRATYLLGYAPADAGTDTRFRRVRVTIPRAGRLRVRHREGYVP